MASGGLGANCGNAQAHLHTVASAGLNGGSAHDAHHVIDGEALLAVELRSPLHLHEAHAIGRLVLHQFSGDAGQRVGGLQQLQREVEPQQQFGLGGTLGWPHQGVEHALERGGRFDALLAREFDGGDRSKAPIEVQVQFRLGHLLHKTNERG